MASAALSQTLSVDTDYLVRFGDIEVNFDRCTVSGSGGPIPLTASEYELLTFFVLNPGKDLTRDEILQSVWCSLASPNTRTVDAHVLRLRQKLEPQQDNPRHFLTVFRVGYRFCP